MKKILFLLSLFIFSCKNTQPNQANKSKNTETSSINSSPVFDTQKISEPLIEKEISISENFDSSSFYNFEIPSKIFPLPISLLEISGLSYYLPQNQLLAVNDEKGWIYFLNPENGEKIEVIQFAGNGDYEGIEWIGKKISIVKSKGDIYFYDLEKKKSEEVVKTQLDTSNDIEGLAFDEENNQLLLACKGNPNLGKSEKYKKVKNIYSFDLEKNELREDPFLTVADDSLEEYVKDFYKKQDISKKEKKELKDRANDFSPSGIAIHPLTKDIYMLSSQGKTIVIFDVEKKLKEIIFLDKKIHRQPEGICFAPNGDLFISNEGKGLGAKIMRYNFLKK